MPHFEFKLPDIGEGVVEGEIVKWLVKAGDPIVEDQPLVEVMTDKATVTIPSPRRGQVVRTVGSEGEIAKVHQTLVVLEVEGTPAAQATISMPPQQAAKSAPQQAAAPQGNGDGRKVLATPVTRKIAREMGVDLAQLHGSGPQGRVMKADVLAHAEFRMPAPLAKAPAPRVEALQHDEVRPLRGLRKSIARSMVQSHAYVVPFTFVEECDTAALTEMRERINAGLVKRGDAKVSYLPFIAKALLRGFAKYPDLNAIMDEEKQSLVVRKEVNLGFGAATDAGLTVFVVKDVAHRSLRDIGTEIDRLAVAARENRLQLPELHA